MYRIKSYTGSRIATLDNLERQNLKFLIDFFGDLGLRDTFQEMSLLFLIYVNDIQNCACEAKLKLFADDTNLFVFGKSFF